MVKKYQNCDGPRRFSIVEVEPMILDLMIDMIGALGYAVAGTASTLSSARHSGYNEQRAETTHKYERFVT
jgi:hypothetical protein